MRVCGLVCFTALVSLFAIPAALHAQFQNPTPDELKMSADPKAPGAAAVYLYREETTDDMLHFHSYYERIKILSEKGKEQATIRVPYEHGSFKVTDIKGRTIHADGTIVPLTAKPEDLMDVKGKDFQVNQMVFTLPSAEVGSILEYRLQLRYNDDMVSSPTWQIQQPFFVHKAHYVFTSAYNRDSSWTITNDRGEALTRLMYGVTNLSLDKVVRDQQSRYTVDLTDIPPTPAEDWMPPLNTINQRVKFYYTWAGTAEEFWQAEGKHWAKSTDRFINPKDSVKKAADDIVGPTDAEEQKARKIYAAVMKLENTDFSRKISEAERKAQKLKVINNADDVWKQQRGSADEIALLYVSLARAAGLRAWPMKVVARDRALFDPGYLSASQLEDYIVVVELGGNDVFLDPGQKMCPYGQLHWKHTLTSGFRLGEKGATLASTPHGTYKASVVKRIADLTLEPQGAVTGTVRFFMTGPEALQWRQKTLENDEDEVKKQFNESIQSEIPDGVDTEILRFAGLDDGEANLEALVKITGNLGTATGKHVFLPGFFFEARNKHPFVEQSTRITPIDVHYPRLDEDEVTYHLPAGFAVESAPKPDNSLWAGNANLRIATQAGADKISIAHILVYNYSMLDAKSYPDLHSFYQKVAAADQQQLVLTRPATSQGN